MNLERLFFYFLSIGLISAVILLAFPKVNYMTKAILVSLTSGLWICLSINFLAINAIYISQDKTGIFILISMTGGIVVSIVAAGLIMAFFVEKKKLFNHSDK